MRPGPISLALVTVVALAGCGDRPSPPAATGPVRAFDHHVHLLSPTLVADWKRLGVPFSRPDSIYTSATAMLADTTVEGALLVSMSHLYSSSWFRQQLPLDEAAELAGVRRENDYIAEQVQVAPERLVGFCSVNPRRPYAAGELARCRDTLRLRGVKVHLGNSDVDPRDTAHVARVLAVARWAESSRLPLLLHLDPGRPYLDRSDMAPLIAGLVDSLPSLDVIVAHLGGSGGYGEWTQAMLDAVASRPTAGRSGKVWFDLSAVVLERESEGVPPTTDAEAERLAADLRRTGLERVVFGTDYPVFGAADYLETLRRRVPLQEDELARILANRAVR